jgi:hypothetical protein
MKLYSTSMAMIAIFSIFLVSCDKNTPPKVTLHELGLNNTKTVQQGSDLHIDAEIIAPLKIASIQLIIHSEDEHPAHVSMKTMSTGEVSIEWKVDSIYTKGYVGVKNAEFHEHIQVPATANLGHYHVHIKVTDMEGNQTIKEDEIEVLAGN